MTEIKIGRLSIELSDVVFKDDTTAAMSATNVSMEGLEKMAHSIIGNMPNPSEEHVEDAVSDANTKIADGEAQEFNNVSMEADVPAQETDDSQENNPDEKEAITFTVNSGDTKSNTFTLNISPKLLETLLKGIIPE